MSANYLIKASYYSEFDDYKDHVTRCIVVADSYADAMQIFQEDLKCHIVNIEVRELALTDRIVDLSKREYDRKLAVELGEEDEEEEEEEDPEGD